MTVDPVRASICQGGSVEIAARVTDQNGNPWVRDNVGWQNSAPSVLNVQLAPPPGNPGYRRVIATGIAVGQGGVTAFFAGMSATATVKVNECPPSASVTGPYSVNLYTSGRFTATASSGVPPYTYEFRRQDCSQFGSCLPYANWIARGSTNYWDTVVYSCGVYRINVQSRVTDSRGIVSAPSSAWSTAVNNAC
jgi:hypothetical protein